MKILNNIVKIILSLILVSPILGVLGVFPSPAPEMYNTQKAYDFIKMLESVGYITYIEVIVFAISLFCLWTNRVSLVVLLLLPISVNIIGFHAFLDGGLLTSGSIMANLLFLINLYLLWIQRQELLPLLKISK